jgi:hypothetical protein
MFQLFASRNPSNSIATKILMDGGFYFCDTATDKDINWNINYDCDPGFVADIKNGYCYKVASTKENLDDGENYCRNNYDAELLLFDTNSQVKDFIELINAGNKNTNIIVN